ncbi:hypothetical protein C2S53_002398 [Perilla frutescens var. hirtella]|uniref:Dihydroflavonol 4-reductase n=1 Tax=Perilla frutescens var. hirtella TaxID=608512 RepID=A0AAD4JHB4_PERFH|nr:hypothetical protein C2S53_002398 [Perilla frutescens var. hirtella]
MHACVGMENTDKNNIGKGRVCVTGGTGYVGSWLVMRLLQHGYSVNTTVRSSNTEVGFLTDLPGASERLRIFEADLNHPHSFRPAIEGCVGVFLVAHPMNSDEAATTKITTTCTLSILQACLDAKTVKRAVYTSSATTAIFSDNMSSTIINEESWSDPDHIHKSAAPLVASYAVAKTLTEKAALEFAEKNGLELVTLLPSYIHGPFICPRCPASVFVLMAMFLGNADQFVEGVTDLVHVDDVASAHIFLLECPDAKGRYICSAVQTSLHELYKLLSTRYPHYQIAAPNSLGENRGGKVSRRISSKKLLEMGFEYNYGLEAMYDGAVESCKRLGLL